MLSVLIIFVISCNVYMFCKIIGSTKLDLFEATYSFLYFTQIFKGSFLTKKFHLIVEEQLSKITEILKKPFQNSVEISS